MCVAYPALVRSVAADGTAEAEIQGRRQTVILLAMADGAVTPGDWLLVHTGIALSRLDPAEAAARSRLIDEATGEPS